MEMANEKILRSCIWGWMKITTLRCLRIHQGTRKKWPQDDQRQCCTAQADETRRAQSQVEHHRAIEPTVADGHIHTRTPRHQTPGEIPSSRKDPSDRGRRKILAGKRRSCGQRQKTHRFGESWTVRWHSS